MDFAFKSIFQATIPKLDKIYFQETSKNYQMKITRILLECAFFYLNGVYNAEIEYFLHINSFFFGLVTFTWLIIIIIIIL